VRHKGSAADAALPRAGLAVAAVAAVIVLVTAGFPLASAALPDQQPLAAGTVLVIGPGQAHSARLTVGRGWALLKAESNQDQLDSLRLGAVQLTVAYIALLDRGQAGDLWAGLNRIIRSGHPGSRLGAARLMADVPGEVEDTGSLTGGGLTGQAEVLADPPLDFAIEITALAPQGADAAGLRAAALVARSLRIAAP
jgi:hypothetical protein